MQKKKQQEAEAPVVHKRIRSISPESILERNFKHIDISERFEKLLGLPPHNFNTITFGKPKNGKSSFSLQFAEELSKFGKVLYVSAEEFISKSLQDRIRLNNIQPNKKMRFIGTRDIEVIERVIDNMHPRSIIIDSVQSCKILLREFERLKLKYKNRKSWHLVSQTTNSGRPLLAQGWFHDVDVKIEVRNGKAVAEGRFRPDGYMVVFEKAKKADLFSEAEAAAVSH